VLIAHEMRSYNQKGIFPLRTRCVPGQESQMHTIRDWPSGERPREKLLLHGPGMLSDAELLAVFLRTGLRGKTAVDLARELLTAFGGLRPLLDAEHAAFCAHAGLGDAKFAQLQAVMEMARRHLQEQLCREDTLENPATAARGVRLPVSG
jgi:DNA repair protein RadC